MPHRCAFPPPSISPLGSRPERSCLASLRQARGGIPGLWLSMLTPGLNPNTSDLRVSLLLSPRLEPFPALFPSCWSPDPSLAGPSLFLGVGSCCATGELLLQGKASLDPRHHQCLAAASGATQIAHPTCRMVAHVPPAAGGTHTLQGLPSAKRPQPNLTPSLRHPTCSEGHPDWVGEACAAAAHACEPPPALPASVDPRAPQEAFWKAGVHLRA